MAKKTETTETTTGVITIKSDKKLHGAIYANIARRLRYVEANLGVKFDLVIGDDSHEQV